MKRLLLPLSVAAALVLAGCSVAGPTGSSAPVGRGIRARTTTTTKTTTVSTTTTLPVLPPMIPVETDSNAVVTFTDFSVCSLRHDTHTGGVVDATASGTATIHPPAGGGDVEMDIVDGSGNVLEEGLATPLQSYVFSGQPVSLETVFPSKDRASDCVVRWVTPAKPPSQGVEIPQLPPPTTVMPTPTTYSAFP